jgi:hypothetical protein
VTPYQFHQKIAAALTGCQLVEQELKLYISEALELVTKALDGRLPFRMSGQDYQDSPLETLIKVFGKLSNNPVLSAELNDFKTQRNFLSHRAITHCLDHDGELDVQSMTEMESRLSLIFSQSKQLCTKINDEANKFRGHLWFD